MCLPGAWRMHVYSQDFGVQQAEGDATVPLISLGLMCRKGWQSRRLNPSGMRVVTREKMYELFTLMCTARSAKL